MKYGYWTSIVSALACWAAVLDAYALRFPHASLEHIACNHFL